eukprot:COSAG02_NODE_332_length_24474_cov_23.190949_19_plen_98_part_00
MTPPSAVVATHVCVARRSSLVGLRSNANRFVASHRTHAHFPSRNMVAKKDRTTGKGKTADSGTIAASSGAAGKGAKARTSRKSSPSGDYYITRQNAL